MGKMLRSGRNSPADFVDVVCRRQGPPSPLPPSSNASPPARTIKPQLSEYPDKTRAPCEGCLIKRFGGGYRIVGLSDGHGACRVCRRPIDYDCETRENLNLARLEAHEEEQQDSNRLAPSSARSSLSNASLPSFSRPQSSLQSSLSPTAAHAKPKATVSLSSPADLANAKLPIRAFFGRGETPSTSPSSSFNAEPPAIFNPRKPLPPINPTARTATPLKHEADQFQSAADSHHTSDNPYDMAGPASPSARRAASSAIDDDNVEDEDGAKVENEVFALSPGPLVPVVTAKDGKPMKKKVPRAKKKDSDNDGNVVNTETQLRDCAAQDENGGGNTLNATNSLDDNGADSKLNGKEAALHGDAGFV